MGEWLKLGTSAGAVDLQLVSDWKPRGLWSAESSFKSALIQQHMSVLQYLRLHGSTPCSGVVAASGVVPCYDETQAQCVMSMPQARQCCSRSVGFAVWEMGDGQYERGDLDSCSGSDAACSSVARATLGRDFVTKIAVSSMKSPIFTAARAHRALARLRLARFPWRSLPKGRRMPAFFISG